MKLRVEPEDARARLTAELEAHGGRAVAVGETLELSYPVGQLAIPGQERMELLFFVRAWAAADPSIEARVVA